VVLQGGRSGRAGHTRNLERILDRNRKALQRAPVLAPGHGLVCSTSATPSSLEIPRHHRVDFGIEGFDPLDIEVGEFQRTDLPLANHFE